MPKLCKGAPLLWTQDSLSIPAGPCGRWAGEITMAWAAVRKPCLALMASRMALRSRLVATMASTSFSSCRGDARELPHFFRIGPTGPDDRSAPRAGGPRRLHDLVGVTCVDGSQNQAVVVTLFHELLSPFRFHFLQTGQRHCQNGAHPRQVQCKGNAMAFPVWNGPHPLSGTPAGAWCPWALG